MVIQFEKGVYFMIFNIVGFILLPLLVRTKMRIDIIGNLFIGFGAIAIVALTYFSGGLWSPILPWLAAVPILALLVVNQKSAIIWGSLMTIGIIAFGLVPLNGYALPVEYDPEWKSIFYIIVSSGLLLIVLVISLVFAFNNRQALDTLAESNKKIAELNQEKDYIIQIMAHDLRNPLHAIQTISDILKKDAGNFTVDQMEFISMIEDSSTKASDLITKVTAMGAAEQRKLHVNLKDVNVSDVLNKVIGRYELAAGLKEIKFTKEWDDGQPRALVDETFLIQVFENLVSNAIKFSPKKSTVHAKVKVKGEYIRIDIKDGGPGFSDKDKENLFGKFARLSAQPTAGESSTGLGLFLVKKYVELMEGKIWCESKQGKGANFKIKLQRAI